MVKIAMIGAGSAGFCRLLVQDILTYESMKRAHIALMDIDHERLDTSLKVMENMKFQNRLECSFSATTDRREALKDANFAICMIQAGGLDAYTIDVEIPLKHGVDQCVGDTLNPGGIFRGLRHVPILMGILKDIEEVSKPNVIFLNYANPMAICTWAIQKQFPHIASIGLCHGVQHTTNMLCDWLRIARNEVDVLVAGINHMAWFLKFEHWGKDLYPLLWEKLDKEGLIEGEHYRFEMMKATSFFMTESSGHLSEYLPYFRHRKDIQDMFSGKKFAGETAGNLRGLKPYYEENDRQMDAWATGKVLVPYSATERSVEWAGPIINAKLTGQYTRFVGNILNTGNLIENLSADSCVEVPIFVDRLGMYPTRVGKLPDHCAALCNSNISVQRLAVRAAIEGDMEAVFHACLLDPLTAATLAPHEIRNMVDEMLIAEAQWLPQFAGKTNDSPGHRIGRIISGGDVGQKVSKLDSIISFHDGVKKSMKENTAITL
ncbi:MAG: alpha-galactosidase [Phycisphaerae bacterium]